MSISHTYLPMYRRVQANPFDSRPACFGLARERYERRCPMCGGEGVGGGWVSFGPGWRRCPECAGACWLPVEGRLVVDEFDNVMEKWP